MFALIHAVHYPSNKQRIFQLIYIEPNEAASVTHPSFMEFTTSFLTKNATLCINLTKGRIFQTRTRNISDINSAGREFHQKV